MERINMEFNEYQQSTARTANPNLSNRDKILNWALGIGGEAGEVLELVKKHMFHGKDLDIDKAKSELGDVLYYVSEMCSALHLSMAEVASYNIEKLRNRYPEKFELGGGIR
jgi:NTP pyrophosphatase (non-canonical NTP hydrolase)